MTRNHMTITTRKHSLRRIVSNGAHLWECRYCGRTWLPGVSVPLVERAHCR